jgi:hypothetical protein
MRGMGRSLGNRWSYWIRGVVDGATCALAIVVAVMLAVAALRNEYPVNRHKGASMHSLGIARQFAAPIAVPVGAGLGLALAECIRRSHPPA